MNTEQEEWHKLMTPQNGPCAPFSGLTGHILMCLLTILAGACYVIVYCRRLRKGTEERRPGIFVLDVGKIFLGQCAGFFINLINTRRNAHMSHSFDPMAWYFPTFLADEFFSCPLGLVLGRGVNSVAKSWLEKGGQRPGVRDVLDCLTVFGRYSPDLDDSDPEWAEKQVRQSILPPSAEAHRPSPLLRPQMRTNWDHLKAKLGIPDVRMQWWLIQLIAWLVCVIVSRFLGGFAVVGMEVVLGKGSPSHILARVIYSLPVSCAMKQWAFAGVGRITVDFLMIALVDYVNRFRRSQREDL